MLEAAKQDIPEVMRDSLLTQTAGFMVYNTSRFTFEKLLGDADHLQANLIYLVLQRFAAVDLSPKRVSNADMGTIFEELIRRFAELSNETAGHHFTPRKVIRLMVHLLLHDDDLVLRSEGQVRALYDPCAGTGGML